MSKVDPAIVAVIEDWSRAYEGDDPERVIDLYTDDAVIAVQGRGTVNGGKDIAALLRQSLVKYDRKVSVLYDRAEVNGTWAYVYGRSWITLAPRDGSPTTYLFGRFTVLLRKCDDGKWRIFIDMDQPSLDVDAKKPHFGAGN